MKLLNKFLIFLIMCLAFATSGFSDVTITSCGYSSVVSDETYLINLTSPSLIAGTNECITLTSSLSNVTFIQLNDVITFQNTLPSSYDFFGVAGATTLVNLTFQDFNMVGNNAYDSNFFVRRTTGSNLKDITIIDSYFEELDAVIGYDVNVDIDNIYIRNSQIIDTNRIFGYLRPTTEPVTYDIDMYLIDSVFIESYESLQNFASPEWEHMGAVGGKDGVASTPQYRTSAFDVHLNNSVMTNTCYKASVINSEVAGSCYSVFYDSPSIAPRLAVLDTDNNNVHDSDVNLLVSLELFGTTYISSVFEGKDILGLYSGATNVFYTSISEALIESLGNDLDYSGDITYNFDEYNVGLGSLGIIILQDNQILRCGEYLENGYAKDCQVSDASSVTNMVSPTTYKYRGLINVLTDNVISRVNFQMTNMNQTAEESKINLISNPISLSDSLINNVTITTNIIYSDYHQDVNNATPDIDLSSLIKLRGDEITITGNQLFQYPQTLSGDYHTFAYIDSPNPTSNEITLNTFTSNNGAMTSIVSNQCDTYVYHNDVRGNVTLHHNCEVAPMINKQVGYLHTDNNIYYFTLGNYYGTCTDAGGDGICDSDYVGDGFTDTRALSEFPFVFANHLASAESSSNLNEVYEVNLTSPLDNSSISIDGISSNIDVTFQHNSTFPDLTCDYVIDGSIILSGRIYDTNNSEHTQGFTSWGEGNHNVKINCFNDFQDLDSSLNNFSVSYTGGGGSPTNETGGAGSSDIDYDVDGFDYIDLNDIDGTTDNVITATSNIGAFLWNIAVPILIGFVVIGAILLVVTTIR